MLLKPRYAVLNGNHPLAKGLLHAWPLTEGGGQVVQSSGINALSFGDRGLKPMPMFTKGGNGIPVASGYWTVGAYGPAFFTGGQFGYGETTPTESLTTNTLTLVVIAEMTGSAVGLATLIYNRGTASPALALSGAAGSPLTGVFVGVSNEYNGATGITVPSNRPFVAANVVSPTGLLIYLNDGVTKQTFTIAETIAATAVNSNWTLGVDLFSVSRYWPGKIYGAYVYNRSLTRAELDQLSRDPWAMFRQKRRFSWLNSVAGGLSFIFPSAGWAWAHNGAAFNTAPALPSKGWAWTPQGAVLAFAAAMTAKAWNWAAAAPVMTGGNLSSLLYRFFHPGFKRRRTRAQ